ncbi:unnamed protein product [Linum trigynum]|uniref:Uncharacterized protein n=1 Tax=Linum trigynum TaxID=586398 RepID=A0AAV2ERV8_9ROSI
MSSSRLSDLSWAELREQARRIGRRWIPEELPIAQEEVIPKETDGELPLQLSERDAKAGERRPETTCSPKPSELTWAQKQELMWQILDYWKSYSLRREKAEEDARRPCTVEADWADEQQTSTHTAADDDAAKKQPSMAGDEAADETKVTKSPPALAAEIATVLLSAAVENGDPDVEIEDGQQLPSQPATTSVAPPPTQFAAVGQPFREQKRNKAVEVPFAVVTEDEGGLASFFLVPDKEREITPEQEKRRHLTASAAFPSKEKTFVFEKEPKDEIAGSIATPNRPANWRFRKKKVRPGEGGCIAVASLPCSRRYLEPPVGLGEANLPAATAEIQTAMIGESRLSLAEPHVTISRRKEELASIDAESNAAKNRIVARGWEIRSLLAELGTATAVRNELEKKPMIRTATGSEARLARQARQVSLPSTRSGYRTSQSARNPTGTAIAEKKETEHSPENEAKRLPSKKMTTTTVAASTVEKTMQESGRGVCWSPRSRLGDSPPDEEPEQTATEEEGGVFLSWANPRSREVDSHRTAAGLLMGRKELQGRLSLGRSVEGRPVHWRRMGFMGLEIRNRTRKKSPWAKHHSSSELGQEKAKEALMGLFWIGRTG